MAQNAMMWHSYIIFSSHRFYKYEKYNLFYHSGLVTCLESTNVQTGLERKTPISQGLVTVTHLWKYTNTAIADISPRRVLMLPHWAPISLHRTTSVSWCFTSDSRCWVSCAICKVVSRNNLHNLVPLNSGRDARVWWQTEWYDYMEIN